MAVVIVFPFKLIGQQYLKYFVPPTLEKSVQIKKCGFLQTLPPMIGTCLLNMQFFNSEGFPKGLVRARGRSDDGQVVRECQVNVR